MRNPTTKFLIAIFLLATSSAAFAHPGHNVSGLAAGMMHSFSGFDHLLVILAVGLWAALRGGRKNDSVYRATRVTEETISQDTVSPKHARVAAGNPEVRKIHRAAT